MSVRNISLFPNIAHILHWCPKQSSLVCLVAIEPELAVPQCTNHLRCGLHLALPYITTFFNFESMKGTSRLSMCIHWHLLSQLLFNCRARRWHWAWGHERDVQAAGVCQGKARIGGEQVDGTCLHFSQPASTSQCRDPSLSACKPHLLFTPWEDLWLSPFFGYHRSTHACRQKY